MTGSGGGAGQSDLLASVSARADGRQVRWEKHNASRRRLIIEAALAVIDGSAPGAELRVQQIAATAGLSRTVVYRHFEDRADLDHAIREAILEELWERLAPQLVFEGTVPEIIARIVGAYVDWAVEHPGLHRIADYDTAPEGPLERVLERVAGQISLVIADVFTGLGRNFSADAAAALDPLVYGLVGAVFGAVRRWISRSVPRLSAAQLKQMTNRSVWFVIDGHARDYGVVLDPHRTLEELLTAVRTGQ